jgi:hypothetical protein
MLTAWVSALAQQQPNLETQRAAMKKLEFMTGKWSGDATVARGPGQPLQIRQTEDVQYKLDGLILLIEGTGRNADGKVVFNALAVVSYDEAGGVYRMRSYSGGRQLDTELKLNGQGFEWGFEAGPAKINNVMRLSENGEWIEVQTVTVGSSPPRNTVEMTVRRQK